MANNQLSELPQDIRVLQNLILLNVYENNFEYKYLMQLQEEMDWCAIYFNEMI